MDFNDVMDDIIEALQQASGEWIAEIYNSICTKQIEYVADGIWDEKE